MSAPHHQSYMTEEQGDLPFCPGCGHTMLINALDAALVKLQPDPKNVVIVTDIGCIGLSDRHFITNAFHGLHGRSITYGCGLKLARPELKVIVLQGDGGCGIGGTHLLNVARRNIGITLIIGNNFNYGMTGGQHSVTTPTAGITSTTPWGNVEGPMDLCGTAAAAGAAWVYRATTFDDDLSDVIARAIEQPGFAMIDILELCTAYYSVSNALKKKSLFDLMQQYGLGHGLLVDKPRPEYSVRYREAYEKGKRVLKSRTSIEAKHPHAVRTQTGIVIAGSAGQKIKSTATLFAQAAMFSGLEATQKDDYPITVKTGHSLAEIIVSPERIDYTAIDTPDYFLVVSEDGLKKARGKIAKLPESSTVIIEESLDVPETKARVVKVPLEQAGKKTSRLAVATIGLSALLQYSGMFPVEAFETAITTFQKPAIASVNVDALRAGAELVKKQG